MLHDSRAQNQVVANQRISYLGAEYRPIRPKFGKKSPYYLPISGILNSISGFLISILVSEKYATI